MWKLNAIKIHILNSADFILKSELYEYYVNLLPHYPLSNIMWNKYHNSIKQKQSD